MGDAGRDNPSCSRRSPSPARLCRPPRADLGGMLCAQIRAAAPLEIRSDLCTVRPEAALPPHYCAFGPPTQRRRTSCSRFAAATTPRRSLRAPRGWLASRGQRGTTGPRPGQCRRIGAMAAGIIHTSYSSGYPSRSRQRNEEAPSGKLGGPGLWPKHARSHAEDRSWPRVRWRRLVRASGPAPVTDDGARLAARSRQR